MPDGGERDGSSAPKSSSIEHLYLRHAPDAVRLAFLLTSDAQAAEDLVQEAFIRVAGRFRHLRDPEAFAGYLRRTVVNLCMSHHRRQRRERRHAGSVQARVTPGPDLGRRDELRSALAALPERQRAAVVLRFYGDLSEEQTARALACSVPAARSLVLRAMRTLRTQIRGDDVEA